MSPFLSQTNHHATFYCRHKSDSHTTTFPDHHPKLIHSLFSMVYHLWTTQNWKYTLLAFSLHSLIHIHQCETIIMDTWNDDYIRSPTGDGGWLVTDSATPSNIIDSVTQGTVSRYHGPFTQGATGEYSLTQYFQCAVRSNVQIWYMYSHCGSQNGASDYLRLLFDDTLQTTTTKIQKDNCLDDDILESVSTFCAKSTSCSSTVGPWSQTSVGPIALPTVEPSQQFKIQLDIGVNSRRDGTAISNVVIQCISNTTNTTPLPTTTDRTTANPTTPDPTTLAPTTTYPTTGAPSTLNPITIEPTIHPTAIPTTSTPTTTIPTTTKPTTYNPTTTQPTATPTTDTPTTSSPTTMEPTTTNPTTMSPTSFDPTTSNSTTAIPTTGAPTTVEPTTLDPTTNNPTTVEPTVHPATTSPSAVHPSTSNPTAIPSTGNPTTTNPTTGSTTTTTDTSTTSSPTTMEPTTTNPTTMSPTTFDPTTSNPTMAIPTTTTNPTTVDPTTGNPTATTPTTGSTTTTTDVPTMVDSTTDDPTTANPTTLGPTPHPITVNPTTSQPTTVQPTTTNPTTSNPSSAEPSTTDPTTSTPTTSNPSTATPTSPSTAPPTIPHPTEDSTDDDNERRSQLKLRSDEGQCHFLCWECLQQIDIIGDDTSWDLTFVAPNDTNCTCPQQEASKQNNLTASIGDISAPLPEYQLKIEKYIVDDDEYGLRLNVLYWERRPQNCIVSYYVNANEFLGVRAQNVLSITFTICGLSDDKLTPEALAHTEREYVLSCAQLFNVSETDVNATIDIGWFCDTRRRLLASSDKDQEVTIVVIFADSLDAKAAQQNACDAVKLDNPEINGECDVHLGSEDDILYTGNDEEEDVDKSNSRSSDALEVSMIVGGSVALCLFIFVVLYWYTSHQKKIGKKTIELKYGAVSTQSPDSMRDIVTGHERVKSHKIVDSNSAYHERIKSHLVIDSLHEANVSINALPRGNPQHEMVPSNTYVDTEERIQIHIRTSTTITHADVENVTQYASVPVDTPVDDSEYISTITKIFKQATKDDKVYSSPQDMIEEAIHSNNANEIEMEDITMGERIGHGRFGTVYRATWQGNVIVVKQLKSDVGNESAKLKEMKAEILLASSLPTHSNLVEIFGFIRSPFGVVMHYMAGGSVQHFVYRQYRKSDTQRLPSVIELLLILQKAAAGLKFLHSYELVHRDIACRNILLGKIQNNRIESSTQVRISDFGLTRQVNMDSDAQRTQSSFGPLKWMAPESIKHKTYSKQSDVYMFGITMWEIFYGIEPYSDVNAANVAINVVKKHERPQIVDCLMQNAEMADGYKKLMTQCWAHDAKRRPSFTEITDILSKLLEEHPTNYWE
eukprot:595283_1